MTSRALDTHRLRSLLVLVCALAAMASTCMRRPGEQDRRKMESKSALAIDHMNNGRYRQALAELLEVEKIYADDAELQFHLGLVYMYGYQQYDEARQRLQRAIALRGDYPEAENTIGVTYMEEQRYAEAIPHFEKAMNNMLYETPHFAQQNLGWALYKSGQVEEGLSTLEQAVEAVPTLCGGHFWLGQACQELGKLDQAIRHFETYRRQCDSTEVSRFVPPEQRAEVLFRLGMLYQGTGDIARGREALELCVERYGKTGMASECEKSLTVMP